MEFLIRFVTADVQLWLVAVLAVGSLAAGRLFRRAALVDARQAPDLDAAYDVWQSDDDPPEEPGDDDDRADLPAGEEPVPAEAFYAAILPRCHWSLGRAEPWPAGQWVAPDPRLREAARRLARVVRRRRLVEPVLVAWGRLRAYLAERWEAAGWERSDESPWSYSDFRNFPPAHGGRHRADVFAQRADETGWQARHGFEEVPPSIVPALALMTPIERARELVRQLGQTGWLPLADRRLRGRRAYTFPVPSIPILAGAA